MNDVTGVIAINVRRRASSKFPYASVANQRPAGILERMAASGMPDLRRMTTLLFGLCPVAHLVALDAATCSREGLHAAEREAADGGLAREALALEALLENMRVLIIDAAALMGDKADIDTLKMLGRLRAQMSMVADTLLSFENGIPLAGQQDSVKNARAQIRDTAVLSEAILRHEVFGCAPIAFYDNLTDLDGFLHWSASADMPTAAKKLAAHLATLPENFGSVRTQLLPDVESSDIVNFADEIYHRLRNEPGFGMIPVWDGTPCLTGALVRQRRHPALLITRCKVGVDALTLLMARLLDTASLFAALTTHKTREPSVLSRIFTHHTSMFSTGGIAMVETARGLLTHAVGPQPDKDQTFHGVISPTEWQFSPEGPAHQALQSAFRVMHQKGPQSDEALYRTVQLALFGLDACVPLDIQIAPSMKPVTGTNA